MIGFVPRLLQSYPTGPPPGGEHFPSAPQHMIVVVHLRPTLSFAKPWPANASIRTTAAEIDLNIPISLDEGARRQPCYIRRAIPLFRRHSIEIEYKNSSCLFQQHVTASRFCNDKAGKPPLWPTLFMGLLLACLTAGQSLAASSYSACGRELTECNMGCRGKIPTNKPSASCLDTCKTQFAVCKNTQGRAPGSAVGTEPAPRR